jgi:hypothetical protein
MDHDIELRFQQLQKHLEKDFGPGMDMSAFLFAICTLLEPYGYYTFDGRDADLWPHFTLNQQLPPLNHQQQQHLLKEALLDYFIKNDYYHEVSESL